MPLTATETAAAASRGFRTCFVDGETPSAKLATVELADGALRLFISAHLDEPKAARASCHLIAHHGDRFNRSRTCEQSLQLRFAHFVGQISDVQLSTHKHETPLSQLRRSRASTDVGGYRLVTRLNFRKSESGAARYAGGRHSTRQDPSRHDTMNGL